MKEHRWSGWPGAFCLECGCGDPLEMAMADNNIRYLYDGKISEFEPYDEEGNLIVDGVVSFIDPKVRLYYPSDDCSITSMKGLKNGIGT